VRVSRAARSVRRAWRAAPARPTARLTASLRRVHDRFHAVEERCEAEHGRTSGQHRH
jgi:hypothetical protein